MTFKRIWILAILIGGLAHVPVVWADEAIHVVQPGESLYRIGLLYGVPWTDIATANQLPTTTIYPGQTLIIPGLVPAALPTSTPTVDNFPAPASEQRYIVQPGDTLSRIAQAWGVSLADLIAVNQIANPSVIYAGWSLVIPVGQSLPAPEPSTPPAGTAKTIVIDLSEQHLYAYDGATLIYSFIASTGAVGMETRPGTYSVETKLPNAYGGNWNIWMPNWLGIYWAGPLQNGIHALPILSDGSRLWDGYLGTPVSFGCIILGETEAQQLYDWAELGTSVVIQN